MTRGPWHTLLTFKSIKTFKESYDYIIRLLNANVGWNWLRESGEDLLNYINVFHKYLLKKNIFWFCQYIFAIVLLSLLGKEPVASFSQTWILVGQGCFVHKLVEIGQAVLQKNISNFLNVFRYVYPWKRVWLFNVTNLNPLHPRMLCAKFGWN